MRIPVRFVLGTKNLYAFAIATIALLYGIYSYIDDLRFYFHDDPPVAIGQAIEPDTAVIAALSDGDYVSVSGIRSVQGGILDQGFRKEKHMVWFFLGSPRFIVVEPVSEKEEDNAGGKRVTVSGRAYNFATSGKAARMRAFFENRYLLTMDADGWLIRAGEKPGGDITVPVIVTALTLLLILNILLAIHTLRRPAEEEETIDDDEDDTDEQNGEPS